MRRALAFIFLTGAGSIAALAQSSWTNGTSANWNAGKWANGVPTASSDVFITNEGGGGIYTVTLTNYAAINSLALSAPSTATNTFKLNNTAGQLGSLYLSNGMSVGPGSIFDTLGRSVTGSVTIAAGGRMAASTTAGTVPATIAGVVTNEGDIHLISGSGGNRMWDGLVNNGVLTIRYGFQTSQVGFTVPNSLFLNAGGSVLVSNENQATRLGLNYSGGPVLTNSGTITLHSSSTSATIGSARITVGGDISGNSGGSNLLVNAAGGQIFLTTMGGTNASAPLYTSAADLAAILRNEGTLTVSGTNASRVLAAAVAGISTNAGLIVIRDQATLDFYNSSSTRHSLVNQSSGVLSIGQAAALRLLSVNAGRSSAAAGTFRNEGSVTNLGAIVTYFNLTNAATGSLVSRGSFSTSVVNQGTMTFLGGTSSVAVGTLANLGSMGLEPGAVLTLDGPFLSQGTLTGSGTLLVNTATNAGTLAPGNSPGTLTFSSNLTLDAASVLNIELGGTNAPDVDHLVANGELSLGGTLNVTLINGYTPSGGDTVDILDWGSILGTFSTINLPSAEWSAGNLYTDGTLIYAMIPEPGVAWGVLAGCGLLACWRRSRRTG